MILTMSALLAMFLTSNTPDDAPFAEYFRIETAKIAAKPLLGIKTGDEWKAKRPELQTKLKAMLGLVPELPRGDLKVEIRSTTERPDFVIEKILYQSIPGLYVTANLYRPKKIEGRLPAILYVCGHSKVEKDGVIIGNKAHYQHHAAWFAANGYVCLIVDTLELGEIPGEHHGTYNKGRWWWQSRGYTPAGVEAWNAVRGIDYLVSRPDVDASKIGVTGRSGGGATSWWVGAIDDRVAAVCPVAGITDLQNHVVDGVVEGHCDCMYFANTERWDYTIVAALVAPKPLFIENTDKDPIFPESGVRRIYSQTEKVYEWYGAKDKLSLLIGKGGHADTEELRHPSFAFFEKYLKGNDNAKIVEPDRKVPIEDLKVLVPGETLVGSRNATIDETFIPKFTPPPVPAKAEEWAQMKTGWLEMLKTRVVAGWPTDAEAGPLYVKIIKDVSQDELRLRIVEFTSQPGVRLQGYLFSRVSGPKTTTLWMQMMDEERLHDIQSIAEAIKVKPSKSDDPILRDIHFLGGVAQLDLMEKHFAITAGDGASTLMLAPRGIGSTRWPDAKDTHVRRRFMLLGQTLDGMRAFDARRALAVGAEIEKLEGHRDFGLNAGKSMSTSMTIAALFEPDTKVIWLASPPPTVEEGPAFWTLSQRIDMPQLIGMLQPIPLLLIDDPKPWKWATELGAKLDPKRPWPSIPRRSGR